MLASLYGDDDKYKINVGDINYLLDPNNDTNKNYIGNHNMLIWMFSTNRSISSSIASKLKELNTTLYNLEHQIKPAQKSTEKKVGEVESTEKAEKTEESNEQQSSNESSEENQTNEEQNNNENNEFEDSFEDDNEETH